MKKPLWITMLLLVTAGCLFAQPWIYDFGTGTGNYTTTNSVSTGFLPQPPSGTARVRVSQYGGGFYLQNPGLSSLGLYTELRMVAPSSYYANKFSVYDYSAGKTFYTQFDVVFGNSGGGSTDSGEFYFTSGDGLMYNDNGAYYPAQVFSGLRWVYGSSGRVTTTYRNGDYWISLGSNLFTQGNVYRVEVYGNNSTSSSTYGRSSTTYSVAPNKQDIWVNRLLVGDDIGKSGLPDDSNIDSFLFYSLYSTGNVANCFLDNIIYSNSLPTYPTQQASGITFNDIQTDQLSLSWENGNGSKRVVIINTENGFVSPLDGTDPVANSTYSGSGQQVVYNGEGSSVTVSGLDTLNNYWFKVFEVSGSGIASRYNTNDSPNNPLSLQDGETTLPLELTSFTVSINYANQVSLLWLTQSESALSGFCVYRNNSSDLSAALLVSSLIPATNTSSQQLYQFNDREVIEPGTYYYWLQVQDLDGSTYYYGPTMVDYSIAGQNGAPELPLKTGISEIYPNPFNPDTTIQYQMQAPGEVHLEIYNMRGQLVKSNTNYHASAGTYKLIWNGKDDSHRDCASGVYQIVMKSGTQKSLRKVVLAK